MDDLGDTDPRAPRGVRHPLDVAPASVAERAGGVLLLRLRLAVLHEIAVHQARKMIGRAARGEPGARRLAASPPGPYSYRSRPRSSRWQAAAGRPTRGCAPVPGRELIERVRQALGDRYTVITAVGRGGNASIFGAHDASGHRVAIKVLHPELAVSVAADRFLREIRYATQLDHPHIAKLIDSGQTDYLLWFVMPYVPGDTLRQLLRREHRLSTGRTTRIGCEVLDALAHAHEHGIAHRDIKPDNIVLSPQGAVLVDLGIARAIAHSGEDRVTRSGFVVGTEEYMSPEQAAGAPDVDGRTDVYSLGVV